MASSLTKRAAENAASAPDSKRQKPDVSRQGTPSKGTDSGAESSARKDKKEKRTKEQKAQEKEDNELQKHLLNNDESLRKLFIHLASEKPEDISNKEFARRFWAARWYLIEDERERRRQQKASSHVFSQLKTRRQEGSGPIITITRDQVGQIFSQYPVVRRVYDDIVQRSDRPVAEKDFWSRFFSSRLFKTLKGEPYTDHDPRDQEIDKEKYLNYTTLSNRDEDDTSTAPVGAQEIPKFIDLEGNEANTKWKGNRAGDAIDREMRARGRPILNILNNMSEKILQHVTPNDSAPAHAPVGQLEDETYAELRLRDLQAEQEEDRVILQIRDAARLHAGTGGGGGGDGGRDDNNARASAEARAYSQQDPAELLSRLTSDLSKSTLGLDGHSPPGSGSADLSAAVLPADFEPATAPTELDQAPAANGSSSSSSSSSRRRQRATENLNPVSTHLLGLLTQQAQLNDPGLASSVLEALPEALRDNLVLSFHSLTEFLHIFHAVLFSSQQQLPDGGGERMHPLDNAELKPLLDTLTKTVEVRIAGLAGEAGKQRGERLARMRQEAEDVRLRTQGRRRLEVDEARAGPGGAEVLGLVAPMVKAVAVAKGRFEKLVKESGARV